MLTDYVYGISYLWYGIIGSFLTVVVALISNIFTRKSIICSAVDFLRNALMINSLKANFYTEEDFSMPSSSNDQIICAQNRKFTFCTMLP